MAEDSKRLIQSRRGYRAHLKRLFSSAGEILGRCSSNAPEADDSVTITDLIAQLERKSTKLSELDSQLLGLIEESELEAEVMECEEISAEISKTIARLKHVLQKFQGPTSVPVRPSTPHTPTEPAPSPTQPPPPTTKAVHTTTSETQPIARTDPPPGTNSIVRLPRLDLPTFSGDALEWQAFWDGFDAAVNSNPTISAVQKLNYLRSQLRGEASHVIAGFSLTSDNYETSVTLLKDRYGQSSKQKKAHLQALLDLPKPSNTLASLQSFSDTIEKHVRSLTTLGKSTDTYGDLLVPVILSKLPPKTKKNMVREHDNDEWDLEGLQDAIRKEIRVFEAEVTTSHLPENLHHTAAFLTGTSKAASLPSRQSVPSQRTCAYCKGSHSPLNCEVLTTCQARKTFVGEKNLCFNCLGRHKVSACTSRHRCHKCHRKHHTSLCTDNGAEKQESKEPAVRTDSSVPATSATPQQVQQTHVGISDMCLLKTAVSTVSFSGTHVDANILFDEGSQRSFVSKGLADCLQIQPHKSETLSISTFGTQSGHTSQFEAAVVHLHTISGHSIPITVLIVPTIAAPMHNVNLKSLASFPYLTGLRLAHPVTSSGQFTISLLIGADHYWDVVEDHIVRGNGPTAMQSKLGYLLSGPMRTTAPQRTSTVFHVAAQSVPEPDLQQFWSVESLGISPRDESANTFLEQYITNSIEQLPDGSYSARFPWKDSHPSLPTNLSTCVHRTKALARKLAQTPALLSKYNEIIADQERRGFIERIDSATDYKHCHYIPHHAVHKDSATTPLRVVYDCSCQQSRDHPSLNDCLHTGEPQLNDLCSIILRFRVHPVGLCTDIEKAFLHIWLHKDDRDCTRFLWLRNPLDPDSELQVYRFKVVLFGAVCSPFMLNATLHYHLSKYRSTIAHDMLTNLYVDNIVSGCQSVEEAHHYYHMARSVMKDAQFNLRSWASNSQVITDEAAKEGVRDDTNPVNVLGLQWNTQTDSLSLSTKSPIPAATSLVTKRDVLRESSKIFDPLGLLSPVTIKAKTFMQRLWQNNVHWDEPLADDVQQQWLHIARDIQESMDVVIPRQYFTKSMASSQPHQLHVFADASPVAYGAVAFLCRDNDVSFVMAKSRVAPLKQLTLPKLELMGALTAAKLCEFISKALTPLTCSTHFWTDSQIVLHWLRGEKRNNVFVAHRVTEILAVTEVDSWRFCPTEYNPADLLTRGITSSQLKSSELWNHGPQWLPSPESWPTWKFSPTIELQALAVTAADFQPATTVSSESTGIQCVIDISHYSTLSRLLAVTAYALRFIHNCRGKLQDRITGPLIPAELFSAEIQWVKQCQFEVYSSELTHLSSKSPGQKRTTLIRQLRLFLDNDGLVRCSGRIHNAPLSAATKFPLLLPPKHMFTSLVILSTHIQLFHAGTNATLTLIRQKFWIPSGRQCVKSLLRRCATCRRHIGKPYATPDPPPLPNIRTRDCEPFSVTGIDFTGAMYVRQSNTEMKVYICLFTCATTRAIHLEVVTDLTVETFLLAFRRFASRRSLPQVLVSDNASTYSSAADELQKLLQSDHLTEMLGRRGVQWQFIPKRAPWYGGWWEHLIGLTKMALKKVLGRSRVTLTVLETLVVEVEAILNDRPLTHISPDIDDAEPLTPANLLHGRRIMSLPYEVIEEQELSDPTFGNHTDVTRRAQLQAFLLEQFKSRWRHEYLTSLREYHRVSGNNTQKIKPGDIVLVHDDTPRITWKLAVIEELIMGKDGLVRAANIRTAHGRTNRPIARLIPLEVSSDGATTSSDQENCTVNKEADNPTGASRPQRMAAQKARAKMKKWTTELGGPPEDVVD